MNYETEWEDLLFTLIPKKRSIVHTNQTTAFELSITNFSDIERKGKIVIQWVSSFGTYLVHSNEVIKLDPTIQPNETKNYSLEHEERVEGTVICQIANIGKPELFEQVDDKVLENQSTPATNNKILYSYTVRDEAMYSEEQRRHKEVLQKIDTMKNAIATTILNQLKEEIYKPDFIENLRAEYQKTPSTNETESKNTKLQHFR